ncbi:MAG: pentapeptide repeat-containing protein, partial [Pseudanabaenales cyanobacterium]|nr:pentapeptide repeat-containing protein [Pseudanabaenales cyanobacterium]
MSHFQAMTARESQKTPQDVLSILKAGIPLSQADLYQLDLRGFDLSAANLNRATLIRADLSQSNLIK